jgi:hypothetical protein
MLLGLSLGYFLGGFIGASIALILGTALLFVYYFTWRSEDRNELLHVVEPNPPAMPVTPIMTLDAQQIAEAAATHAVEAMVKEGQRNKLPIPELRRNAVDLARRLREFQRKYLEARSIISNRLDQIMMLPKAEQTEAFNQNTASLLSLADSELFAFGPLRVEAIIMRRDLLDALHEKFDPPEKIGVNQREVFVKMVLDNGSIAGPHPIYDVADYIEYLAQRLKQ